MSANDTQVGGSHYRTEMQHWDVVIMHGVNYLEGQVSKYVTRWRRKNRRQDLEKARHFALKMLEAATPADMDGLQVGEPYKNRSRGVPIHIVHAYARANGLDPLEAIIIDIFLNWQHVSDIQAGIQRLDELLMRVPRD